MAARDDSNCAPRSDVKSDGTSKQATQFFRKGHAAMPVVVLVSGIASGQHVNLSTQVRRWV